MLTTERDALLENKKSLKTSIEELWTSLSQKTNESEMSEAEMGEKLKTSQQALKAL